MAPEYRTGEYNEKVDIWAAGIVMYELFTGTVPFHSAMDVVRCQIDYERYEKCFDELSLDLMKKIFEKDPKKRLSAKQVLDHEYFKEQENDE